MKSVYFIFVFMMLICNVSADNVQEKICTMLKLRYLLQEQKQHYFLKLFICSLEIFRKVCLYMFMMT